MNKQHLKLEDRLDKFEKLLLSNKTVLTFDEACDYTGISKSYMYTLTSKGKIPCSRPTGKIIFFSKQKLDDWLLENGQKGESEIEKEALSYVLKNKR